MGRVATKIEDVARPDMAGYAVLTDAVTVVASRDVASSVASLNEASPTALQGFGAPLFTLAPQPACAGDMRRR